MILSYHLQRNSVLVEYNVILSSFIRHTANGKNNNIA